MKNSYLCKFLIILCSVTSVVKECHSQILKGIVYDQSTKQVIPNALVKVGNSVSLTNNTGYFSMNSFSRNDTLSVKVLGYKDFKESLNHLLLRDTIKFFLFRDAYELKEVLVRTKKDYLKDSLALRNTYSSIFNYKYQPLKDFIIYRDFFSRVPTFKGQSSDYIAVVDLLSLLNLVNSKKKPVSKLQEKLIRDENQDYLDRRFSKQLVQQQTGLKGDSLFIFMNKYKPDVNKLKGMNEYQLGVYITNSYKEYLKGKNHN